MLTKFCERRGNRIQLRKVSSFQSLANMKEILHMPRHVLEASWLILVVMNTQKQNFIWQHLGRCHDMSLPNTRFWKWSNGVKKVERDLFWCISMTNNVYSCKQINGRAQTFKFSVFTMGRQELLAKNMKELRKLGKLKRLFLNFFKYYDPPRVAPCERAWPGLSENV